MKLKTFYDNFEIMAEAPNGIPKLREMILQLAVQGKLVPQDPKDEPASVFLEKIKAEKERLVKEGKLKSSNPLPEIKEDESPYDLATGWLWVRLNDLFNFIDYRGKTPTKTSSGIRLITAKNIRKGFINLSPEEFISEKTYKQWMTRGYPAYGDILFTTEAPLANVARVTLNEKFALAQRTINFQPYLKFDTYFLVYSLMSENMQSLIRARATGMTATGIKSARLKLIPVPLPPIAEQKRIVAKVDELMAFCDEYEAKKQKTHQTCIHLNDSSIDELLTAPTLKHLNKSWQRIHDNFDTLYSKIKNVAKLRQAILQLAVQGKLVKQDPKDEPASVLLKKIKAEKENLIKEKKIKKTKPLRLIDSDDVPFKIPDAWEWVRLEYLIEPDRGISYGIIKLGIEPTANGIKTLRCSDVLYRKICTDKVRSVSPEISDNYSRTILQGGEVLMNIRGTLGGCGIVSKEMKGFNIAREVALIPLVKNITNSYILDVLSSPYIQINTIKNLRGIAYKGLNLNILREFVIPLPPKNEQKRIVAKVDELMAFCDELEIGLTKSQSDSSRLLESALNELLAA